MMGFHLALVAIALLMFGVFADQPVGGRNAKAKAKAAASPAAEAAKVLPTCQVQLRTLGGELCPISEELEYDESKDGFQLPDDTAGTAKDECCKKQITCAEFVRQTRCPDGHRQREGRERNRFPARQLRSQCCQPIPRFQFVQGGNWAKHLNKDGEKNKAVVWAEISKLGERWWKDGEYWFRRCGNIYGTYVSEGVASTCVIGLQPDGTTINHLGPFGSGKNQAQINAIFETGSVVIGADWQPPRRSFSKVGIIMESNEHHLIILAGSIVGLSAAFYMAYKYTKKTDAHYAKLVDEEV